MSSILERSILLDSAIRRNEYYVNLYEEILKVHDVTPQTFSSLSNEQLIMLWNEFWMALPDSRSIRRDPFFQLCDLAEEIYND